MAIAKGISVSVITYPSVSACFSSVVIAMNEQVAPSVVVHRVIVEFLTNENVVPAEILTRLRDALKDPGV
jgi:hypothetical protein